MTDREAMKMALEALDWRFSNVPEAIEALRTALAQSENPLDIADRAYFAGKQDGVDETLAQPTKPWVGLDDNDFQYQTPQYVLTMKYAEAILRDKNK